MVESSPGFFKRHWIAISGLVGGIGLPSLYLYLQLVVWKRHGDDLMLTAAGIVVTVLLWLLLVVGIVRYWSRNPTAELESEIATLKNKLDEAKNCPPVEVAHALNLEFIPSRGKTDRQLLAVKNKGVKEIFRAQCRTLRNANSKIEYLETTFDLGWDGFNGTTAATLSPDESRNLLIAIFGKDGARGTDWIALQKHNGSVFQHVDRDDYYYSDKDKIEYLLEITIIGESLQSCSQQFVVRPGKSRAIEMEIAATPNVLLSPPADAPKVLVNFDQSKKRDIAAQPLSMKVVKNRKLKLLARKGDAFSIQVEPIDLLEHTVTFEAVGSLLADREVEIEPFVERKNGVGLGFALNRDLDIYLMEDWDAAGRRGEHKGFLDADGILGTLEHVVPISVVYQDMNDNWYRTRQQLRFDAFHHTVKTEFLGYDPIPKPK